MSTRLLAERHWLRLYVLAVMLVYLLVVLLGLTTSHTSIVYGSESERSTTIMGQPRNQRSDEFLRGSPRVIASLQEIPLQNYTPLDYTGSRKFRDAQSSVLGKVVRWTAPLHEVIVGELSRRLPLSMGFSLQWWSSHILLLLVCPLWFKLLGCSGRAGVYCALAVVLAPPSAWFSNLPAFLLGNAVGAAVAVLVVPQIVRRLRRLIYQIPLVILLGIYAGRMAFTTAQYPPWGFPIIGLVGLVSLGMLWRKFQARSNLLIFVGFAAASMMGVALIWIHNRTLYSVALDTVYPGKRRDTGGTTDMSAWSGALSWFLQGSFARQRGLSNPEYALGPSFLVVPAVMLLTRPSTRSTAVNLRKAAPLLLGIGWVLLLISWAQYKWPRVLINDFNPFTWIPSSRAAQIASVLVLVLLFLVMGQRDEPIKRLGYGQSLVCSILVVVLVSDGIRTMKAGLLSEADNSVVVWTIALVLAVTFLVLTVGQLDIRAFVILAFLASSTALVNPLTRGLGAYEQSEAKSAIMRLASERPSDRWATSGFFEDALMISTGVPQLSGQQPLGPNKAVWRLIDPKSRFVDNWNRGQSYITFAWDGRPDWTIWNPSPDVIQIVINPCAKRLSRLRLGWVVSIDPAPFGCLKERATFRWMGNNVHVYERTDE